MIVNETTTSIYRRPTVCPRSQIGSYYFKTIFYYISTGIYIIYNSLFTLNFLPYIRHIKMYVYFIAVLQLSRNTSLYIYI